MTEYISKIRAPLAFIGFVFGLLCGSGFKVLYIKMISRRLWLEMFAYRTPLRERRCPYRLANGGQTGRE